MEVEGIKIDAGDIKVVYDLADRPREIVIRYEKFIEILDLIEDKEIEKKLKERIKDEVFVGEGEIFDV